MGYSCLATAGIAGWLLVRVASSQAAGFALIEQNASGMGNAYAGAAAVAEDASTVFFNPAGMTYLPDSQLVVGAHALRPSAEFSNDGSRSGVGTAMTGSDGGDAGGWAFVPNFYFSKAINDRMYLGIGVNAPFGLKTEYGHGWAGRYHALKSELKTLNINPSVALRLNDAVSLGLGISYQRAAAELTNAVDFGTVCFGLPAPLGPAPCTALGITPQAADGWVRVEGDDWSWGYNLGAMLRLTPDTRLGLAYRSRIEQELEGTVRFRHVPAAFGASATLRALFGNGRVRADATLPATLSASLFHQASDRWELLADLTWTEWSRFDELRVTRASGPLAGQTLSVQPEHWDNTLRTSVGASYQYGTALKLRVGVAFDESPVPRDFRTPRIPDSDRVWLSLGARYQFSRNGLLDAGYTRIFVRDSALDQGAVGTSAGRLAGDYDSNVNILSVQYTHTF